MVKWKKIASSENGLDLWALSWLLAPHPLWSAFTLTTPRPSGVIREPSNGPAGRQPISHCLFSNQITIFNGDTSPGPSPNRHLFEIVPRNYFTQKFSLCTPVQHSSPHFGLLFVVVCFQLNLPLWISNGQKWAGEVRGAQGWEARRWWESGSWNRCRRYAARWEKQKQQGLFDSAQSRFFTLTREQLLYSGALYRCQLTWCLHPDRQSVAFIPRWQHGFWTVIIWFYD